VIPSRNSTTPAVIVGAGPYGLSLAAHLRQAGIPSRIFGQPMQSWATQMPAGMKLKSDGFASNLSAGPTPFTLEDFCRLTNRPYHPTRLPVAVEDFIAYGQEFARRFVPHLETADVTHVERLDPLDTMGDKFRITLSTGEWFYADRVILATGVSLFQYLPRRLAALSRDLVTHTADHHHFTSFAGREVVVLGRGASSLNAAALLQEAGARVTLLSRHPRIHIHGPASDRPRSLYQRLRHPSSPLGFSLRSWLSCQAPSIFHALPAPLRRTLVYKHLGPAGGAALQGRVEEKVSLMLGWRIEATELVTKPTKSGASERLLKLILVNDAGEQRQLLTSHIIAGTGFRVALSRLHFLAGSLRSQLRVEKDGSPRLNPHFQSSVEGLYFIGPAAAASFGPLLRFAAGAEYAARRVTQDLQRSLARRPVPVAQTEPDPISAQPVP
jgi:putative flavoprotein involved in K+ transport